jgi:hypothetical protein
MFTRAAGTRAALAAAASAVGAAPAGAAGHKDSIFQRLATLSNIRSAAAIAILVAVRSAGAAAVEPAP